MRSSFRRLLASTLAVAMSLVACSSSPPAESRSMPASSERSVGHRKLLPMPLAVQPFDNPLEPVDAAVELCLPTTLRNREWNVPLRAYRVALGPRTAVNFERLVKSTFRDVTVTFDSPCGRSTNLPWIELEIVSAKRDPSGQATEGQVRTEVTLRTTLRTDAGETIWQRELLGSVGHEPGFGDGTRYLDEQISPLMTILLLPITLPTMAVQARMGERAASAFADAIAKGLDDTFAALVAAPEVRNRLESGPALDPS